MTSSQPRTSTRLFAADFLKGFACALGSLAREHGQAGMAVDIMRCNGVTYRDLKQSGVDKFDLDALREEFEESEPR